MEILNKISVTDRINTNPFSGDVPSSVNGDIWYNSILNKFRKKENNIVTNLDTTGGGGGDAYLANTQTFIGVNTFDAPINVQNMNITDNGDAGSTIVGNMSSGLPAGIDNIAIGAGAGKNQTVDNIIVISNGEVPVLDAGHFAIKPATYAMINNLTNYTADRAVNWQDGNGTVAYLSDIPSLAGYVTLTGTQTLTNKTLTTPVINGTITGTGQATIATASTIAMRDANGNITTKNFLAGVTGTATSGGTLSLTASSNYTQYFTGFSYHTLNLPDGSTIPEGTSYHIITDPTAGSISIYNFLGSLVTQVQGGTAGIVTMTGTNSWVYDYPGVVMASTKKLTVWNSLTLLGTDGTYQTFPSTNATIARIDAAQTFTGTQTFTSLNDATGIAKVVLTTDGVLSIGSAPGGGSGDMILATAQTVTGKKTFQGNATNSALGFSGLTANPSSLTTGDVWYRSDENKLRYYDGTTARSLVGEALAQTLTNKTIALGSNTISGTTAQFNTALTDNDFATLAGTETITNKNFTSATNTFPTTEITTPTNAAANSTYTDNATYWGKGTTGNGFPVNGILTGVRKGTENTQRIQDVVNGQTMARVWINGTTSWTAWSSYLDASDLTTKGQVHIATGSNAYSILSAGSNGQVLAANSATATGLEWQTFSASGASLTRVSGASGAAGADITWQGLTANATDNTTVTPATVMTTTGVGTGTWSFKYTLLFQTAALTTGIKIANNHTGTVTTYQMTSHYVSTGGVAATGTHDGIATSATAGLNEGFAERVINTSSKASAGVGTINANQIIVIEGILVVSATGSLELKLGSEVAGSAVRAMAGSILELKKIL